MVASFTDAWIETKEMRHQYQHPKVASFTDAWIETLFEQSVQQLYRSHLLQMRGLKQTKHAPAHSPLFVASFTDAWIETGA